MTGSAKPIIFLRNQSRTMGFAGAQPILQKDHMFFASDNAAGIAPDILAAIAGANRGAALAYGRDDWTKRVERRFADIFEREVAVFLVPTGTAANALALAHLT